MIIQNIRSHFPKNKKKFKEYLKIFLPLIGGSTLFALNGVVDNFMVGSINQGVTALGAVNKWTAIIIGWFLATAAAGSVVMSQFFHNKQYDIVKQISRYRFMLSLIFAIPFFIIAWTNSNLLTNVFYKASSNPQINKIVYQNATKYMRIISFQWILFSFSFNLGNQLREMGYGKHTMYWGFGTLSINILLNSILIYIFQMGVQGAAIASVAGRILAIIWGTTIVFFKKLPISYNLFYIFKINKKIHKLYWARWIYFLSIFTVTFFVQYRMYFYAIAFTPNSLGEGISAVSVLSLTGSIMSVFTTNFSVIVSMSAVFVGSHLGKRQIAKAKENAWELKGFILIMSSFFSLIMILFASFVPYINFLSETKFDNNKNIIFNSQIQLLNVRNSLYVIAFFYPMWTWFICSYRIGNSGGKGGKFAISDWIISGPIQLSWIAILTLLIVPNSIYLSNNFAMTYALFFLSDFLKLIVMEIFFYYDFSWLNSLTKK